MAKLHRDSDAIELVPKEGQRGSLCSNKLPGRCPSLGFKDEEASVDVLLDKLASILVELYLEQKQYGKEST